LRAPFRQRRASLPGVRVGEDPQYPWAKGTALVAASCSTRATNCCTVGAGYVILSWKAWQCRVASDPIADVPIGLSAGWFMPTNETNIRRFSGYRALLVALGAGVSGVALWIAGAPPEQQGSNGALVTLGITVLAAALISLRGLVVVAPNEAKVATL